MSFEDSYRHKGLRMGLIRELKEKGITNERVLEAINKIPRHYFFDKAFENHAYADKAFPIEAGQTISQPYTVAYQSQLLKLDPGMKVLEIGTGSGYQSCVLLELGAVLHTIELQITLYNKAKTILPKIGYYPTFIQGDGTLGWTQDEPYDRIIVTAGAPVIPNELLKQLAIGGILIIPVGDNKSQKMLRLTKIDLSIIEKEEFGNFSFVPLLGKQGW
jgi:protein-L-isoaspartate(D-aspartate) O-methyltransferase